MEHRSILGGEHWLGFARSRIAALRGSGLAYAAQKFELEDATVRVRIEPGHDHIHIEGGELYMESGELSWSFPGEGNPARYDPATLHFMDIPYGKSDKYINSILTSPEKLLGRQKNSPPPTEGMDSRAIGYRRSKDPVLDAARKLKAADMTVIRKLALGALPASLWSGKMRAFVQAQYGALQPAEGGARVGLITPEVFGSQILARYNGDDTSLRLGWWENVSPGIVTTEGGYFFVNIHNPTGNRYLIDCCPIEPNNPAAAGLLRALRSTKSPLAGNDRKYAEAYLFANSTIMLSKKTRIGEFGVDELGAAIAYGWKFNSLGTEASIILVKMVGEFKDQRFTSATAKIKFTYDAEAKTLRASGGVTINPEWCDGWGTYNIFVPSYENDVPLDLFSSRVGFKGRPDMRFSDVPIYGYYKDDVWTELKISCSGPLQKDFPVYEQEESGNVIYLAEMNMSVPNRISYGQTLAGESWTYREKSISEGDYMSISLGGFSYTGVSEYGYQRTVDMVYSGGAATGGPFMAYASRSIGGNAFFSPPVDPPGWAEYAEIASKKGLDGWPTTGAYVATSRAASVKTEITYQGWRMRKFAVAIPTLDSEAVYIATYEIEQPDTVSNVTVTTQTVATRMHAVGYGHAVTVQPYASCVGSGWFGDDAAVVSPTTTHLLPPVIVEVFGSNNVVTGKQGVPGASYTTLFTASIFDPTFHPGMKMITSAGGRYWGTELPADPASVPTNPRFIGRA